MILFSIVLWLQLVEDKHPKNCVISNLLFSDNLDVATTKDELREAQKRENLLAEQDIKVERLKDQRNTLESFVYDTRSKVLVFMKLITQMVVAFTVINAFDFSDCI